MRWERLFDDLEAQAAELQRAERAAVVEGRARSEFAAFGLGDRLRPSAGGVVRLTLTGGHAIAAVLRHVGPDWLQLGDDCGREWLVNLAAVASVSGLGRLVAPADTAETVGPGRPRRVVESRLGLRHAVRLIARDRSAVRVHLGDGRTVDGTPDRVGRDFLELAVHPVGEARRTRAVHEVLVVPFSAIAALLRTTG
jgi:hypothetical protein